VSGGALVWVALRCPGTATFAQVIHRFWSASTNQVVHRLVHRLSPELSTDGLTAGAFTPQNANRLDAHTVWGSVQVEGVRP
jgi:hypothetical protein